MGIRIKLAYVNYGSIFTIYSFIILVLFYPKDSHSREVLSALGGKNSYVSKYYNLWFIIYGIIMSSTSITFYRAYSEVSNMLAVIGEITFILFGVGAFYSK